ncbi:hypothetical protein UF75_3134 [Desulfosporosinus sp. I2]|nr:hypothetical protein UF75_3134 [Desulfosporosinus sp. I2]
MRVCIYNHQSINITVSIGVAIYPFTVKDIKEIVEKADSALYEAKQKDRFIKPVLFVLQCIFPHCSQMNFEVCCSK